MDGLLGTLVVADSLRPESHSGCKRPAKYGSMVVAAHGRHAATANELGRQALFDRVPGQMLPEDKLRRVEELVASGTTVAMIGD